MAYKKAVRMTTPRGLAVFPVLIDGQPDTKFDDAGVYKCGVRLSMDDPEAQEFIEKLEAAALQNHVAQRAERKGKKTKLASPGFVREEDSETGEETGYWIVNAKLKARVRKKKNDGSSFTQCPALFDATGARFYPDSVWGGSEVRLSIEIYPYYTGMVGAGLSLRLKAVQIIELVQAGGSTAADNGFDAVEGGYEAETFTKTERPAVADSDEDEAEDDTAEDDYDY